MKSNYVVDAFDIENKIKAIKQSRYYGYGLIHIAAKHGHESIVSKLLEYNKDMIYWKTSLGQRPSDIACEIGKLNVLQMFSNLDNDMLSDCIYYAARSGNENIILSLIGRKVNLSCISNKQSRDTLEEIVVENFNNIEIKLDFPRERYVSYNVIHPLDKWWIAAKETSVHAAIRSGSTDVAKYLIRVFPGLLDCTDSFGYTPSLLSVVKNQFDLLPSLTDHISTDRCHPYYFDHFLGNENFIVMENLSIDPNIAIEGFAGIENEICKRGSTFTNLSTKYKRENFIKYSIQEYTNGDYNSADEVGTYQIHIAAMQILISFALQ
jgi:ankyrin repeat protein